MLEEVQLSDSENEALQVPNLQKSISYYLKKSVKAAQQLTTNIQYNYKHSNISILPNQRKPIVIQYGTEAFLLGIGYTSKYQIDFIEKFRSIIWMSYRKGTQSDDGDAGWGCMIRVSQMVMAEAYRRYSPNSTRSKIIAMFKENPQGMFSFHRLCNIGSIKQRYTSSLQMFNILKMISDSNSIKIEFQIFNSGIAIASPKTQLSKDNSFPKLIAISNRLGISDIPNQLVPHLKYLMSNKNFCGIMGGIGKQGLYIVGFYQDKFIALDPHYVQQCQSEIYYKSTPRGIPINTLSPSLSICFFISDKECYLQWLKWIIQVSFLTLKQKTINNGCISSENKENKVMMIFKFYDFFCYYLILNMEWKKVMLLASIVYSFFTATLLNIFGMELSHQQQYYEWGILNLPVARYKLFQSALIHTIMFICLIIAFEYNYGNYGLKGFKQLPQNQQNTFNQVQDSKNSVI